MPAHFTNIATGKTDSVGSSGSLTLQGKRSRTTWTSRRLIVSTRGYENANAAKPVIRSLLRAKEQVDALPPTAFGALSDVKNTFQSFAESLGAKPLTETSDIAALKSNLWMNVLEKVRLVAPVSDPDILRMEKRLGDTKDPKAALQQIIDFGIQHGLNTIEGHNSFVRGVAGSKGGENAGRFLVDFNPNQPSGALPGGPSAAPPAGASYAPQPVGKRGIRSVDDILKQYSQ
jgi:hypothetical protein